MDNKILVFDLETSGLNADRGHILCASAKWYGTNKYYTWRIDDTEGYGSTPASWYDDSAIVKPLIELCTEATAVVAYYGGYGKFDVPFLNTRAVANGLQPCPQLSIIDPYTTAKGKLKLERNGLASVSAILKCEKEKYHLPWGDWLKAKHGDRRAMGKILKYCVNDIDCLEEVYTKLLPLISNHPYVSGGADLPNPDHKTRRCPACGSTKTVSKGRRFTKTFEIMRRQCKKCKHNFQSGKKGI